MLGLLALIAPALSNGARGAQPPEKAASRSEPTSELVGEGTISTPDDEFGGGPSPDGSILYFNKTAPPHYLYILCESRLVGGRWGRPSVLPFSGRHRDTDGVLSPDGSSMLFASDRPIAGKDEHRFTIWRAMKQGEGWDDPRPVTGPVNEAGSQVFASETSDGHLYFATSRKSGTYDVFRSRLAAGAYQAAEDLGPILNGPGIATFEALIAPDESYLLLGSFGRANGYGSADLFISFPEGGGWSRPKNLGPAINTRAREYSPRVSADGKWLYYTSEKGMPTEERTNPLSHAEFVAGARGMMNGLGNIYRVPLEPVLRHARLANEMGVIP
jgi:Tol biopolymer transport system component